MGAKFTFSPLLHQQHPVLPVVMLLTGVAPLLYNGYTEAVQLAGFFLAGTGGLLAWFGYRDRGFNAVNQGPFWMGLLFLAWLALGLLWSVEVNGTVNEILRTALYLAIFWQVGSTFGREEVDKIITIIVFTATMVALVGLLEYLFLRAGRIHATFINPNPLGIYLAMVVLIGLGRYWQQGGRLLGAALVINGVALLLSYSRGSVLAFSGGLIISLWLVGREGLAGRLRSLAGLFLATILLAKIINLIAPWTQQIGRAESILHALVRPESFMESSVEGRLAFWWAAGRMFLERPWTGFGGGSFHDVYFSFYEGGRWYSRYVHNHYLQLLAETGLPGLAIFLALLGTLLIPFWRRRRRGPLPPILAATGGAMLAFLLHIFVDFSWDIPAVTLLFWLMAACSQLMLTSNGQMAGGWSGLRVSQAAVGERRLKGYRALAYLLSFFLLGSSLLLGAAYFYAHQGDLAAARNNREVALKNWRLAARLTPWNDTYHARLGSALATAPAGTAAFREGGRELQRAMELSPYDYNHASQLAFYEQKAGHREAAGQLFQKAVTLGGYVPSLYFDLGNFYVEAGQKELAGEIWSKGLIQAGYALAMAPSPLHREKVLQTIRALRLNLARYYEEQGWYGMAVDQLRQVLAIYPGDPIAIKRLGAYREKGLLQDP
ncbi:Tetratricopeptide-like helical [Moorella glycerini]|uniref:O-Antigen ligase n=1 Tax=Neomoorella stamsii TaxID=1266720 RepID=A0A9X7J644_9FIRM|nr:MULTISPECIES: O-antigen ligase family protein [Moorella]PRR77747.1 O-Antigen ligase [Moorella stamsii]CEP66036.1 Tetratricopeptide-like helical [Moorella glycerini]